MATYRRMTYDWSREEKRALVRDPTWLPPSCIPCAIRMEYPDKSNRFGRALV